jgi:APA family basic amino acid/polyamine antiporter
MVTEAAPTNDGLERQIGLGLAVAIAVNSTIGTGIFRTPAAVAHHTGSLAGAFAVWILGALIALSGALTLAELAARYPRGGGLYEYIRRAYGRPLAFLLGWTKLTLLIPSAVGSFGRLAAEAAAVLFALPPSEARDDLVALAVIGAAALVNLRGVGQAALVQGVVTAVKYAGVAVLAVVGLTSAWRDVPMASVTATAAPAAGAFHLAALVSVMWAYDGWADLAFVAGEVRDPRRTLPRAFFLGVVAIAAVYLAANVGYATTLGYDGLVASTSGANMVAANVVGRVIGEVGRRGLAALILVSCLGGCMASLLTGSRTLVPMATDGLLPAWLGRTSSAGVPRAAVAIAGTLGAGYVLVRSFEELTDGFVVGYFPFYVLATCAVFLLRRRDPLGPDDYRVPLYPLTPLVFLVGASLLLFGALIDLSGTALGSFGVMAAGVPVGLAWASYQRRRGSSAA